LTDAGALLPERRVGRMDLGLAGNAAGADFITDGGLVSIR
jgi:hypothetical protein